MKNRLLTVLFLFLEIYLLINSREIIITFNNMFKIIIYNLLPTMFFSILFTDCLIKLEFHNYIPKYIIRFFSFIFNINNDEVLIFIFSIISGYPNNSKMLKNSINLNNIILYTNFVNPIFFICTVSNIYLNNFKLGLIIYLSHILSNILIGILVRKYNKENFSYKSSNNLDIYFSSLKNTVNSLSNIFSNILFFTILISLIKNIINNRLMSVIIIGLLEFSSGLFMISKFTINIFIKGIIVLLFISFGSFSIHMQIISLNEKIKYLKYFIFRIIGVIISTIIYIILYNLLMY